MAAATSAAARSPCTATGHSSTRRGNRACKAVHDVADDRAGRRCDDADHVGQIGKLLLPLGREEPFGLQPLLALLQHRHERAQARELDLLDDDLVARRTGIGGNSPGADDLQALLRLDPQALRLCRAR